MKNISRFTALILALITALATPFYAFAFTSGSIFTSSTYTHQDKLKNLPLTQGVDVSNHNIRTHDSNDRPVYDIDWAKVKASGVKFAIVRIGCRGYASSGTLLEDSVYKKNIEGAYKAGLDVGVYFYSQALTKAEARAEANYVLKRIEAYRNMITLPVYYDYEFAGVSSGRLDKAWREGTVNKKNLTTNSKAFCNVIKKAGFKAGIYASKAFFYENLNYTELEDKYDIWVAHYSTKTDYKGDYTIWQFTAKGTINGINGYVDSNFMYKLNTFDDVTIPDQPYTGQEIYPDFKVSCEGKELRLGIDYCLYRGNNTDYGAATIELKGINSYENLKAKTITFNIVPSAVGGVTLTKRESTAATLKWNAHPDADGYLIRACGRDCWYNAGETTELTYKIKSLSGSTPYRFTVSAYKLVDGKKYYGIPSDELTAVTKPLKVKGIKTASRTTKTIKLKWTKQLGAESYLVYKYDEASGKYELLSETETNSITVEKLKVNTAYKFKIKAKVTTEKGKTVYGVFSNVYTDYTAPKAPKLKSAVSKSEKTITAKWKGVSGATGYQLMWSTSSTFTSNKKSVKVTGATKTTVKTARSAGSYYVRVRAYIIRGTKTYYSEWSNSIHLYTK